MKLIDNIKRLADLDTTGRWRIVSRHMKDEPHKQRLETITVTQVGANDFRQPLPDLIRAWMKQNNIQHWSGDLFAGDMRIGTRFFWLEFVQPATKYREPIVWRSYDKNLGRKKHSLLVSHKPNNNACMTAVKELKNTIDHMRHEWSNKQPDVWPAVLHMMHETVGDMYANGVTPNNDLQMLEWCCHFDLMIEAFGYRKSTTEISCVHETGKGA